MSLITLLIVIFILCLILWLAQHMMGVMGIQEPFRSMVLAVVVLVALVWLLYSVGIPPARIR